MSVLYYRSLESRSCKRPCHYNSIGLHEGNSLVALQSGGGSHPWKSAYVLCQLLIGAALLVIWLVWEAKFAQFPMLPFSIFRGQRIVALTFITVFIAGAQFYSLVNFFPVAFSAMFPPDPIQTGLGGLGFALGGTTGSAIINAILSTKKIEANVLLVVPLVIMSKCPPICLYIRFSSTSASV